MRFDKYFVFLLTLSLLLPSSVFSKFIHINEINSNFTAIQVGIFKERKNIFHINEEFLNETFYVQNNKKYYKLYLVNVKKSELNKKLNEIKKIFPDAFVTRKIFKTISNSKLNIIKNLNLDENIHRSILDSKSILLTRKKII